MNEIIRPKRKLRACQVLLDEDQHQELLAIANENGISFSLALRQVIDIFLDRKPIDRFSIQLIEKGEAR